MIRAAAGQICAQIEPSSNNLIQLYVPLQMFGDEARFTAHSHSEVKRFYRRGVHQHVHKVIAVYHRYAVRGIACHRARRIAPETTDIQWDLVIKETDAAS